MNDKSFRLYSYIALTLCTGTVVRAEKGDEREEKQICDGEWSKKTGTGINIFFGIGGFCFLEPQYRAD
jgi:hypothetical protein